jgi:hypothetical protein
MNTPVEERFKLEEHEIASPVWQKLKKHYETRIDTLRKVNDRSDLSETDTAKLRGQIAEIKAMLSAGRPDRVVS